MVKLALALCLFIHFALPVHAKAFYAEVRKQDQPEAQLTVEELREDIENKPWDSFYILAAALVREGNYQEAGKWFYIGQMRGRAFINCQPVTPDGDPALLASLNYTLGSEINPVIYSSIKGAIEVIDAALAWEASHPDPRLPLLECAKAMQSVREDKLKQRQWTLDNAAKIRADREESGLPNSPE
ncbi:hypothetical protein ACR9YC_12840 [Parasphingorhabdus sp. DH2-15]|uniref:hypothetical protein n=1 Tax=Parasphingorhabdus sp. DH2-15 TaxID=3444112 RepID=UPI003F6857BF